ncbi:hypothetical protein pipiens_008406 [Culex pipiens pipiens]|uniref:Uncharacterized protein n=1 Tax=Culex pipiens pipiens TaxID=38569 RepID=A0ABD1DHJ4_CULPP
MVSFKEVIFTLCVVLLARTCQCNPMATLGTLQQVGQCNPSVFKLGSLAVGAGPNAAIGGTFEVLTELDATYRVGLNFTRFHEAKKVLVSARSGVLCSAIGEFPWLLHDIKITPQVPIVPFRPGSTPSKGSGLTMIGSSFTRGGITRSACSCFEMSS